MTKRINNINRLIVFEVIIVGLCFLTIYLTDGPLYYNLGDCAYCPKEYMCIQLYKPCSQEIKKVMLTILTISGLIIPIIMFKKVKKG